MLADQFYGNDDAIRPASSVVRDDCTAKRYNYYLAIIPKVYDVIVRAI